MKPVLAILFIGSSYFLVACVDDAAEHYSRGIVHEKQGDLHSAMLAYEKATRWGENHIEAHYRLGIIYLNQGRLERAVRVFRKAISLNPKFAEAHSYLGIAYQQQGELEDALEAWEMAVRFNPSLASSHHNLGAAYNNLGMDYVKEEKFEEAIVAFKKAQRVDPDLKEAPEDLRDRGEFDEAAAAYKTVVEAQENLGAIYFNQGKMDEAIKAFETVIQLDPHHAEAHYHLAAAYSVENEKMPSLKSLRKAVSLKKGYAERAKTDHHFENIRGTSEFDQIITTQFKDL